jgi:hypothetical protein
MQTRCLAAIAITGVSCSMSVFAVKYVYIFSRHCHLSVSSMQIVREDGRYGLCIAQRTSASETTQYKNDVCRNMVTWDET